MKNRFLNEFLLFKHLLNLGFFIIFEIFNSKKKKNVKPLDYNDFGSNLKLN